MKGNETTGAQGQALQLLFTYQGLAEETETSGMPPSCWL